MPSINNIRSFIAIVEHGCFSHAAASINITQATLTKRIQHLENEMDCQLFNRTTCKVTLSSSGHALLENWSKSLQLFDQGVDCLKDHKRSIQPIIKVGLNPAVVRTIGEQFINKVKHRMPAVNAVVNLPSSALQIEMVLDGRLDIGFVSSVEGIESIPGISSMKVLAIPMRVVCHVENRVSSLNSISIKELATLDHVFGMRDIYTADFRLVSQAFDSFAVKWNIVKEHLHTDTIFLSIRGDKKLVAIHPLDKERLLPAGLTSIPIVDPTLYSDSFFIWKSGTESPVTLEAIDIVHQLVGAQPYSGLV